MALTKAALKKPTKEEIIKFTLDLQDNFNQYLKCIKKDLSEIRKNFSKLEAELAVTKEVNNVLRNQMIQVEIKYWSNQQYYRRDCLEINSIPERLIDSLLEETALNTFKELGVSIDTSDIKACHRVGPPSQKKVIIKMSRRKDEDRMWRVKKTLRV